MTQVRLLHVAAVAVACVVVSVCAVSTATATTIGVEARNPSPKWDERLVDLVDFVERERGLDFKHPVPVRFLTERQFKRAVARGQGELSRQDRAGLERSAGLLRALGLIEGDGSVLREGTRAVHGAELAAFYDSDKKEVLIRGKQLDTFAKVTVVHELTHTLQDQYFDLNKLAETKSNLAMVALVEGDAMRIEDEYVSTLSTSEHSAYVTTSTMRAVQAKSAIAHDAPAVLRVVTEAPYPLGRAFVRAIFVERGEKGIDTAFRASLTTDQQVLNPSMYLSGADPTSVAAPRLAAGETRLGADDTLGALGLYLMLAARIDPAVALRTIDAWDGDALVQFTREGIACVRATIAGKTPQGAETIATALYQWAALGTHNTASVDGVNDDAVTFTACEPGQPPTDANVALAGDVLEARASVLSAEIEQGVPLNAARCIADRAAFEPDVRAFALERQPTPEQTEVFTSSIERVEAACGV